MYRFIKSCSRLGKGIGLLFYVIIHENVIFLYCFQSSVITPTAICCVNLRDVKND
jgi:hypothetical protein